MKRMKGMKKRITANQSFSFMFFMLFMVVIIYYELLVLEGRICFIPQSFRV